MGTSEEAAEQLVRMTLSGSEVVLKLTGVGRSDLAVLNGTNMTAALVEVCFINNSGDMTKYKSLGAGGTADNIIYGLFGVKPAAQPTSTRKNNNGLKYYSHCQAVGNLENVVDGQTSGTVGLSKRMDAIFFTSLPSGVQLKIRTHSQKQGWSKWQTVKVNTLYGTKGKGLRLEAIQLKATYNGKAIDIYYRAHVQSIGWQSPVKNSAIAGTTGKGKQIEALQIWIPQDLTKAA